MNPEKELVDIKQSCENRRVKSMLSNSILIWEETVDLGYLWVSADVSDWA